MVDTSGTTEYDYDAMYQLTGVAYPDSDTTAYAYDAMGNRQAMVVNGGSAIDYTYDDADQMTDVEGTAYDYDDNGNQIEAGADTFDWDAENRLVGTEIDSVVGSYGYNGEGLRTSRTIDSATVTYVWNLNASLAVILEDSDGNRYVYGLDLLTRINGSSEEWYLTDGLGSTANLADDSAAVTDNYSYDVFGSIRSHSGSSQSDFTFTGEQVDETGLQYLRARYYDLGSGRFLSQDPIPLKQRYPYVRNSPAANTDPSGLCDICLPKPSIPAVMDWTKDRLEGARESTIDPLVDTTKNGINLAQNSYYDLNVTFGCGGTVFTAGMQFDKGGGYGYEGSGRGSCGANVSFSVALNQQVTEGRGCGLSGTTAFPAGDILVGPTGQTGYGGLAPDVNYEGGTFKSLLRGVQYNEGGAAVGTSGWSATCYEVTKYWSW